MSKHIELAVDILVNEMVDSGAPNYKSWLMECNDGNEYLVTVQKKDGETAVEQLAKQQEEIERLNIDMQSLVNLGHEANSRLRNDAIKQQEEIAEYKAFMLGLKLSSEDEARMLRMFDKYK